MLCHGQALLLCSMPTGARLCHASSGVTKSRNHGAGPHVFTAGDPRPLTLVCVLSDRVTSIIIIWVDAGYSARAINFLPHPARGPVVGCSGGYRRPSFDSCKNFFDFFSTPRIIPGRLKTFQEIPYASLKHSESSPTTFAKIRNFMKTDNFREHEKNFPAQELCHKE